MVTSTQAVSSLGRYSPNLTAHRVIADALPTFSYAVVGVVLKYIFRDEPVEKWGAEWIAKNTIGYEIIYPVVVEPLEAFLPPNEICPFGKYCPVQRPALLIWEYIQKYEVFGPDRQEIAAGKGDRKRGMAIHRELLGSSYNSTMYLPFDIDEWMQARFVQIFSVEALQALARQGIREDSRATELFSIHRGPRGMTANIGEKLAQIHGQKFHECSWKTALQEHGDAAIATDCVILFPNTAFFGGKSVGEQQALMPLGYKRPRFPVATFCIFDTFNCTGIRIMDEMYTRTDAETEGYTVMVSFAAGGFHVNDGNYVRAYGGVAPVREFCW